MSHGEAETDFRTRWAALFREIEQECVDILSGQLTVKEIRARQRESAKKLKTLEQEFKRTRTSE